MMRMRLISGLLAGLALCGAPVLADDLEAAQKDIIKRWGEVSSATAKLAKTMKMETNGNTITGEGTGTYEFMRGEGGGRARIEMTENIAIKIKDAEKPMPIKQMAMMLDDGKFLYRISETMGRKNATKSVRDLSASPDLKEMFETLGKMNDVKLLPEAKVGDEACYAIELTPKSKQPTPASGMSPPKAKTVLSFSKKSGMMMRSAGLNEKGEEVEVITYSDVKLNEKLDRERFEFKAPEGVTVTDMTNRGPAPAAPTPAPASKPEGEKKPEAGGEKRPEAGKP